MLALRKSTVSQMIVLHFIFSQFHSKPEVRSKHICLASDCTDPSFARLKPKISECKHELLLAVSNPNSLAGTFDFLETLISTRVDRVFRVCI